MGPKHFRLSPESVCLLHNLCNSEKYHDDSVAFGCCVSSLGSAEPDDLFADEAVENFQDQTGGKTQSAQLDVVDTLTGGDGKSSRSEAILNGSSPNTLKTQTHSVNIYFMVCFR